jgi:hypothetical protein
LSVGFYVDEHVEAAIVEGLRRRDVDVLTVQEDGRHGKPDDAVLDRATELARLLYTQDADFLTIAANLQRAGQSFAGVVFARALKLSIGERIGQLELLGLASDAGEHDGTVIHLPI